MTHLTRLPTRGDHRRIILCLDEVEAVRIDLDDVREVAARGDLALIDCDADSSDPVVMQLRRQGLLRPGLVLVQSPYRENDYAVLDEAEQVFALDKFFVMTRLVQTLGASFFELRTVEETRSGARWEASAEGRKKLIKGSSKVNTEALESLARKLTLKDRYGAGEPDVGAAWDLLAEWNLSHDRELSGLVHGRSISSNPLRERSLRLDLSSEASRTVDAVASLSVPAFLSAKGQVKRKSSESASFRLEYSVTF